jgi:hypothetical protein
MAGRAVLANGSLGHPAVTSIGVSDPTERTGSRNIAQTKTFKVRQVQASDGAGNIRQRVCSRITVGVRIRQCANADTIKYDQDESASSHVSGPCTFDVQQGRALAQDLLLIALADLHALTIEAE